MMDWNDKVPRFMAGNELKDALMDLPEYNESIRDMDAAARLIQLSDLYQIYYPSVMSMEIYNKLYFSMMMSLKKKNTMPATVQQRENFAGMRTKEYRGIIGGSDSCTIIGNSGIGKSSAIERSIELITLNRLIEIEKPFVKLIPVLQVQCPFDSSPKGLLLEILRIADIHMDSQYYRSGKRSGVTTDALIGLVSQVCLNHIGVLVIDEIQNVVKHRNGSMLIGVLMQLINSSGIAVMMVGTPECISFFESEMQLARRSLGVKYGTLPFDEYFAEFCQLLFRYQYTKVRVQLTDGIARWLYEHSGGIIANVVSLYHDAQELAITNGTEALDMSMLYEAYDKRMVMLHSRISPEIVQLTKKSRKREVYPIIDAENTIIINAISISEIVSDAKSKGLDVVDALKEHILIEEVALK